MPNNHPFQLHLQAIKKFATRVPNAASHTTFNQLYLTSYSVHGDKTNEPDCLKQHLEELFGMYPTIQILTGDAIFTQRPLLEALREYNRDYLFQDYICSLGRETTAKQIQEMILGHWQIENCLHLAKDKFYGEDKHAFRVLGMGEVWTAMTGIATILVQLM